MADVVVLNNGVRFQGLIVEENDQKVKLARYSGHTVSPHTLGLYKRDIGRIKRIDPRRRASLEPEVLELLYAAEMARQAAQTAAAWQRVSREIEAHREALEAARRARMTLATGTYPTPQGAFSGSAIRSVPNQGHYGVMQAPSVVRTPPVVRPSRVAVRSAPQVRKVGRG